MRERRVWIPPSDVVTQSDSPRAMGKSSYVANMLLSMSSLAFGNIAQKENLREPWSQVVDEESQR